MTTNVEGRRTGLAVEDLVVLFSHATHPREIELIADHLAERHDPRAIRPLLTRLGDSQVREDADVEDAVCGALVELGVMCRCGGHSFSLRPRRILADDVVATIRDLSATIPWQYFGTRQL